MQSTEEQARVQIPEGTAQLLRDLVHEHTGSYFDASRLDTLLEKLEPLARERRCPSFLDYYYLLKFDGETVGEWARVMDALSVQETYFWREMDQIDALTKIIVPAWFEKTSAPLRIWSAACATGEEPFTIAIALEEAGCFKRGPIEIIASDASGGALDKARRGTYRERAFRCLPPEIRRKYFEPVPQGWAISPEMLVRVRFQRTNLVAAEETAVLAQCPVVFCRNVFIYFSPTAITRTVNHFAERMPENGRLFVGVSESLLRLTNRFELEEIGKAFVYTRKATPAKEGAK